MRGKDPFIVGTPSPRDRELYEFPSRAKGRRSYQDAKPKFFSRNSQWAYLEEHANYAGCEFLEIGSREVTGPSKIKRLIPLANYRGMDIHEGPNVDIVGDVHRLSDYVEKESVDFVYSAAVFEHLALPWLVVEEIAKVLKVGGEAAVITHFSHSEHEYPWHFFQFNELALRNLFCEELGFEVLDAGMESPIVGRFSFDCDQNRAGDPIYSLYVHSLVLARKVRNIDFSDWDWRSCLERILSSSMYPEDTARPGPAGG
jgi:SAM-dependent methyltransferase